MSNKNKQVRIFAGEAEVVDCLASIIQQSANEVLQESAVCFCIGVSGKIICTSFTHRASPAFMGDVFQEVQQQS